jgi:phosphopantothenate-cysteine ligase
MMTNKTDLFLVSTMAEAFFVTESEPSTHADLVVSVSTFLDCQPATARVVLVTSGGTLVPLERQTVRFLDNFSGGRRGAASVENFLEQGYIVVFFHRKFSLRPYERQLGDSTLDLLAVRDDGSIGAKGKSRSQWMQSLL